MNLTVNKEVDLDFDEFCKTFEKAFLIFPEKDRKDEMAKKFKEIYPDKPISKKKKAKPNEVKAVPDQEGAE